MIACDAHSATGLICENLGEFSCYMAIKCPLMMLFPIPIAAKSETKSVEETDICHLARETGKCRAYIPRWGFDPSSGSCVQFVYGGCGGNENNFETKEACEQRCLGESSSRSINLFPISI